MFFLFHIMHIFFSNAEASPIPKKCKKSDSRHVEFEHPNQKNRKNNPNHCDVGNIFSLAAKDIKLFQKNDALKRSNKSKEVNDRTKGDPEQIEEEKSTAISQIPFIQINNLFAKNPEINFEHKASEVFSFGHEPLNNDQSSSQTKLPSFKTGFPKQFYDYENLESTKTESRTQSTSEKQIFYFDISIRSENSFLENIKEHSFDDETPCINEAQGFCSEIENNDSEPNGEIESDFDKNNSSLQVNHTQRKHDQGMDFSNVYDSRWPYNNIKTQNRDIVIKKFVIEMTNKVSNTLQNELSLIIQEELGGKLNKQDNSTGVDLGEPEILSNLQKENERFFTKELKTNEDFEEIVEHGKRLVKFEANSYLNPRTSDEMQKAQGFNLINYSHELKNTKIHFIVPEIKYLLNSFEKNDNSIILKGHALLVDYYCKIIKILANLIFENNINANKNKTKEENNEAKILMNRRIFFLRKLLAELYILFQNEFNKVEIYRILNMINYFSTLVRNKRSYFRRLPCMLKLRYIFRFLFDPDSKPNNNFLAELIQDINNIYTENKTENVEMFFQKKLTDLFYNYYCLPIYYEKVLTIINGYKIYPNIRNILDRETKKIKDLHKKTCMNNTAENAEAYLNAKLKEFMELERTLSYLEKKYCRKIFYSWIILKNEALVISIM
ncbi:hypothetical protein LUQ84_3519 [Hamiltosporidium tvaerminnensis]|nr:hypothetical protein LUQ84_3519 [Hamiltosporidium tvaerminnensis]